MCLVCDLKCISVVARTINALLSPKILDGANGDGVVEWREPKEIKLCVEMSVRIRQSCRSLRVAGDNVMYSLSVVDKAISV